MSNNRPKLERALRRLIRAAIDAADFDQQVIDEDSRLLDFSDGSNDVDHDSEADIDDEVDESEAIDGYPVGPVTSMSKYFRRMARRRLRYAYRDLHAALEAELADEVLPKEVVAILPPYFLVKQIPEEQAQELRTVGKSKGLKGEALDRFVLGEFRKARQS
jgi:hypothetical protein